MFCSGGNVLSTKLDFELEFALQIASQALEARLLPELEEKDETFFTVADKTLDLCALGEKVVCRSSS